MNAEVVKKCLKQNANPDVVESLLRNRKQSVHFENCSDEEYTLYVSSLRKGDWFDKQFWIIRQYLALVITLMQEHGLDILL